MKERPILFSGPMVLAIMDGTKRQTRRPLYVLRKFNDKIGFDCRYAPPPPNLGVGEKDWALGPWRDVEPGDKLWVRERHSIGPGPGVPLEDGESAGALRWPHVTYAADGDVVRRSEPWTGIFGKPRPSIHMPRWACRITLEVVRVRVERLQAISEDDAIAEGFKAIPGCQLRTFKEADAGIPMRKHTARDSFAGLWDDLNGEGAWDANPWVVVIEFVRPA